MAAGWLDTWRRALGWPSAPVASVGGPYYVEKAQVYHAGGLQGQTFAAGQQQAQVYHAGAVQGDADGRS